MALACLPTRGCSLPYTEDTYHDEAIADAEAFLKGDISLEPLRKRFVFGFDVETPEGM